MKHNAQLAALIFAVIFAISTPVGAQVTSQQIQAATSDTHWGLLFLTYDDGPDEMNQADGTYQTLLVERFLASLGLPATFFEVGCHIAGQNSSNGGGQCAPGIPGDVPLSVLQDITGDWFLVANHTWSHTPFTYLTDSQIIADVTADEIIVDSLGQTLGLKILRCPGFDCRDATVLNGQPGLAGLRGPMNADVGGGFYADNIGAVPGYPAGVSLGGGDWWFYGQNLLPSLACYYYVRDINAFGSKHGIIGLFHTRFDMGRDGSRQFPIMLAQCVVTNLPSWLTIAPLDGIPGLLGNIRTTTPKLISEEFGTNDGQGRLVAGDLTGTGENDLCKARDDSAVWCKKWARSPIRRSILVDSSPFLVQRGLAPELTHSSSWYTVNDPAWVSEYGSQFWLVDFDGGGKAAFIRPSHAGPMVGYSTGYGFSDPVLLANLPNMDYRGVRFADVNGDGLPDMIVWTPKAVQVYLNDGRGGLNPPIIASSDFEAGAGWNNDLYLATMQVVDLDGDGCQDLLMRGPTDVMVGLGDCKGHFLTAKSWTKRFSDRQNFSLQSQNMTFSAAKIAGHTGIAAGLFTGGVVFQEVNTKKSGVFGQYRYIMDNHGYSGDPAFHSGVYASDLLFIDLWNDGNTVPVQVRPGGLYASHIEIVQ